MSSEGSSREYASRVWVAGHDAALVGRCRKQMFVRTPGRRRQDGSPDDLRD